jgi:Coenzyme PQQ synthesis protein D (PqqD)
VTEGMLLLRSPHVLIRSFAGETLVAASEAGDVDRFTASAAAVWDLLEEPRTFDDLVSLLSRAYHVPAEVVAPDVARLVRELIERGWVREIRDTDD